MTDNLEEAGPARVLSVGVTPDLDAAAFSNAPG